MSKRDKEKCGHPSIMPKFDPKKAATMTASEVRKEYPRAYGKCPDCGWEGVLYASFQHYIAGDY